MFYKHLFETSKLAKVHADNVHHARAHPDHTIVVSKFLTIPQSLITCHNTESKNELHF